MKRFELFEYDKETKRLNEMAKPVTTPSRLTIDSKYNRNTKRDEKSGLAIGQNLLAFYEMLKKDKKLNFRTYEGKGGRKEKNVKVVSLRITNVPQILKELERAGKMADPVIGKDDMVGAKRILDQLAFKTKEGTFSLYDIDHKSLNFKNTGLSGGGENKYNQGLQCIISACVEQKIWPSVQNAKKISQWVDLADRTIEEILRAKSRDWLRSASGTHRALQAKFGTFKKHIWHEESSNLSTQIYDHMKKCFLNDDIIPPSTNDRWNPADIWIVATDFSISEVTSTVSVEELNSKMVELFDSKRLMGVSLKKASGRVGGIKMKNHPTDDEGFTYHKFSPKHNLPGSGSPIGVMDVMEWYSEVDGKSKMTLTTYGAKNDPDPRVSSIRFGLMTGSGGQKDGTLMGEGVGRVCAKHGIKLPSFGELLQEFKEGYSNDKPSFWTKFAKMHAASGLTKISKKDLRELCYESYPYDEKSPFPYSKKGHAPACAWINVHFLSEFMKKSDKVKVKILDGLYRGCASIELGCAHIVIGKEKSVAPLKTSSNVKMQGPPLGQTEVSPRVRKIEKNDKMLLDRLARIADKEGWDIDRLTKKERLDVYNTARTYNIKGTPLVWAFDGYEKKLSSVDKPVEIEQPASPPASVAKPKDSSMSIHPSFEMKTYDTPVVKKAKDQLSKVIKFNKLDTKALAKDTAQALVKKLGTMTKGQLTRAAVKKELFDILS